MSVWSRISEALAALAGGEGLSAVFDRLRTPPERTIAFTIAVIALGAKMAKADGEVTRNEVAAFREVFAIAPGDEAQAARVFNLARQDVAGFDAYARKVGAMFGRGSPVLADLMEGLFHIAAADGTVHPREDAFLRAVADAFGIDEAEFRRMAARFDPEAPPDPWAVLGLPPDAPLEAARAAWKQAVRDNHPDVLAARGLPAEALRLAEARLVAVNRAWEEISRRAGAGG
ncbi:MAG: molecular chaperone DjiA [Rhodobacteraceae bacterium]|nr:molecular chaperone DjiA [Paracoccaceae bacterium]